MHYRELLFHLLSSILPDATFKKSGRVPTFFVWPAFLTGSAERKRCWRYGTGKKYRLDIGSATRLAKVSPDLIKVGWWRMVKQGALKGARIRSSRGNLQLAPNA